MSNIFSRRAAAVGLAIGDTHVRGLQLGGTLAEAQVVGFAEAELPKTVFGSDGGLDVEGFARVLELLFNKQQYGQFTTRDVALNLPESNCFVRVIHVAPMSDSEIDAAVPFEAESYIPIPVDQVYLDWKRLGESNGRVELLLVASPREFVDRVLKGVELAGLTPVSVEVQSEALARSVIPLGSRETVLIADMKAARTDLIMVERGNIQFTSTIPIAGQSLTDAIAKGLELQPKRAEEIKAQAGFANTTEYPNLKMLLLPVLQNLVNEIKQVLTFHDQHSTEKVTRILLVGGAARLGHVTEFVQESLADREGLLVQLADPTVNIHMEISEGLAENKILAYAPAVGLAMRELF
ncbi:MAG: type IV pilus assembly protein PilM [Candidatus Doudnabacteria bacterium]|nr:type IV pilus assembly protein PilM [Candidatus Doudnabacteria bacterium]